MSLLSSGSVHNWHNFLFTAELVIYQKYFRHILIYHCLCVRYYDCLPRKPFLAAIGIDINKGSCKADPSAICTQGGSNVNDIENMLSSLKPIASKVEQAKIVIWITPYQLNFHKKTAKMQSLERKRENIYTIV